MPFASMDFEAKISDIQGEVSGSFTQTILA